MSGDSKSAEDGEGSRDRPSGSGLVAHILAWLVVLALLGMGVPKVEALLRDFGVELPGIARIIVKTSHLVISYVFALVPFLIVIFAVDGFVLAQASASRESGWSMAWSALMLGIPLLIIGLILAGLALPLISLFSKLSG